MTDDEIMAHALDWRRALHYVRSAASLLRQAYNPTCVGRHGEDQPGVRDRLVQMLMASVKNIAEGVIDKPCACRKCRAARSRPE